MNFTSPIHKLTQSMEFDPQNEHLCFGYFFLFSFFFLHFVTDFVHPRHFEAIVAEMEWSVFHFTIFSNIFFSFQRHQDDFFLVNHFTWREFRRKVSICVIFQFGRVWTRWLKNGERLMRNWLHVNEWQFLYGQIQKISIRNDALMRTNP